MAAYSAFAEVYDALMNDFDYDAWSDYYMALIARAGVVPKCMCDCACGTGQMSVRFASRDIRVTGVDLSGEMLAIAQRRAREAGVQMMFVQQDMCELSLPRAVDAIVCACDGINYLLDDARLSEFFRRAYDQLRSGGALAFDISSAWKLRHVLGDNFYGEERDDVAYLWSNRWDDRAMTVTMDLTFFAREPDGRYRRFTEVHVQKAHETGHIVELLGAAGFGGIEVFGDQSLESPGPTEQRVHFLAIRND